METKKLGGLVTTVADNQNQLILRAVLPGTPNFSNSFQLVATVNDQAEI